MNYTWKIQSCSAQGLVMRATVEEYELEAALDGQWQNRFYDCGGYIICSITRLLSDGSKIMSRDGSGYSPSEAFRNACLKWGVGLEVHLMPTVTIPTFPRSDEKGGIKYVPIHNPEKFGECNPAYLEHIDGKPSLFVNMEKLHEYTEFLHD